MATPACGDRLDCGRGKIAQRIYQVNAYETLPNILFRVAGDSFEWVNLWLCVIQSTIPKTLDLSANGGDGLNNLLRLGQGIINGIWLCIIPFRHESLDKA